MLATIRQHIQNKILSGLVLIAPIIITAWMVMSIEEAIVKVLWRGEAPFPGAGLIGAVIIVYILGLLITSLRLKRICKTLFPKLLQKEQKFAARFLNPFLDWLKVISSEDKFPLQKTLLIPYPHKDIFTIAFLTNQVVIGGEKTNFIFVPQMPNFLAGYLLFGKADEMTPSGLNLETSIRTLLSLGLLAPPQIPNLKKTDGDSHG